MTSIAHWFHRAAPATRTLAAPTNRRMATTENGRPHDKGALKLLTLIVEEVLEKRIVRKALELDATSCTCSHPYGHDLRDGLARLEIVCAESVADAIVAFVSDRSLRHYACVAVLTDVAVARSLSYVKAAYERCAPPLGYC
jgi:hypothetical protein